MVVQAKRSSFSKNATVLCIATQIIYIHKLYTETIVNLKLYPQALFHTRTAGKIKIILRLGLSVHASLIHGPYPPT